MKQRSGPATSATPSPNRIAHHEPIHKRDLSADMLTLYRVLDWIDPDVRTWAISLSRLQPLITARPR